MSAAGRKPAHNLHQMLLVEMGRVVDVLSSVACCNCISVVQRSSAPARCVRAAP